MTIDLIVPNLEAEVYIVGNQESIFRVPLILMKSISDDQGRLNVHVHYPAVFKFMTGSGKKTAIVEGYNDNQTLTVNSKNTTTRYKIADWK